VGWSGGVDEGRDPARDRRRLHEEVRNRGVRGRQVVARLTYAAGVQPHDVAIGMIDRAAVVIVRRDLMRRDVSVRDGLRVIVVRFVDVFGRERRRQGEPGRHQQRDDASAESIRHGR